MALSFALVGKRPRQRALVELQRFANRKSSAELEPEQVSGHHGLGWKLLFEGYGVDVHFVFSL